MDAAQAGFIYTIDTITGAEFDEQGNMIEGSGVITDTETVHNLIPIEGINYLISAGLKSGAPYGTWYIGLYTGAYTPLSTDTAALFPSNATECTAYTGTTPAGAFRQQLILGAVTSGACDNTASLALFTGTTNGTLAYGGFITTSSAIGSITGVLISAVKFSTPKALDSGTILRVTAGFSVTSS